MVDLQYSEDALRKSLENCNVCNVALVEEVKERSKKGESVNSICKDLEDFQRQMHGEIYYSANALRQRYLQAMGVKDKTCSNRTTKSDPYNEVMKSLKRANRILTESDVPEEFVKTVKMQLGVMFSNTLTPEERKELAEPTMATEATAKPEKQRPKRGKTCEPQSADEFWTGILHNLEVAMVVVNKVDIGHPSKNVAYRVAEQCLKLALEAQPYVGNQSVAEGQMFTDMHSLQCRVGDMLEEQT